MFWSSVGVMSGPGVVGGLVMADLVVGETGVQARVKEFGWAVTGRRAAVPGIVGEYGQPCVAGWCRGWGWWGEEAVPALAGTLAGATGGPADLCPVGAGGDGGEDGTVEFASEGLLGSGERGQVVQGAGMGVLGGRVRGE